MYSTASVIGYEDTQPVVTELSEYLVYHEFAALWFHPSEALVLVAYGAASDIWNFLHIGQPLLPGPKLRILVRNRMPRPDPVVAQQPPEVQPNPQRITNEASHQFNPVLLSTSDKLRELCPTKGDAINHVKSPIIHGYGAIAESTVITNATTNPIPALEVHSERRPSTGVDLENSGLRPDSLFQRAKDSTRRFNAQYFLPGEADSISSTDSVEDIPMQLNLTVTDPSSIDTVFQDRFKITFDRLTRLNMAPHARRATIDPGKARFYLSFSSNHTDEMEALQSLLSRWTLPNLICTSQDRSGWDAFRTILGEKGDHIGVIIVSMPIDLPPLVANLGIVSRDKCKICCITRTSRATQIGESQYFQSLAGAEASTLQFTMLYRTLVPGWYCSAVNGGIADPKTRSGSDHCALVCGYGQKQERKLEAPPSARYKTMA